MQRLLIVLPLALLLMGLAVGGGYFVLSAPQDTAAPVVSAGQFDSQPLQAELEQNSPLEAPAVDKPTPEPDPLPEQPKPESPSDTEQPKLTTDIFPSELNDELAAALEKSDLSEADKQARMKDIKVALETLKEKIDEQAITISGHVYNHAGKPMAGASVYVQNETGERSRRLSRAPMARSIAVTAEDGSYSGQYMSGGSASFDAKLFAQDQYNLRSPVQKMNLTPGQAYSNIDFTVPQGAGISGRVVDQNYAPIAGAKVVASNSQSRKSRGYAAVTDDNGEFTIRGLSAGEFNVSAYSVGYKPQGKPKTVNVIEGDPTALGADLVLQTVTSLKLKLLCPNRKPTGYATVYCYDREGNLSKLAALCDRNGEAIVANVPENTIEIAVGMRGFETTGRIPVSVYKGAHSDAGSVSLVEEAESAKSTKDQKRLKLGEPTGTPKSR